MGMKKVMVWLLMVLFPLAFLACGGGGGSSSSDGGGTTTTSSLTVASKVSVVDAKLSGSVATGAAPLKVGWSSILRALSKAPAASSDYYTDQTNVYVQERSVEAFDTVNNILCMMAQSKYDAMLNKGSYTAQIDGKQCSSSNSDASSAGQASTDQSSGSDAPQYELWTMNSSRADNSSPQYVKVWIHEKAHDSYDQDKTILVKVTITEGKSDTNPIGLFTVNFKGVSPTDPSIQLFWGTLKSEKDSITGKILLKFAQEEGPANNPIRKQYATLDKATDGSDSGAGKVYQLDSWSGTPSENSYNVAFNADFFLRKDAITPSNPDICLNRNAYDQSAWQYGLYNDTTGARITRNSGFPIKVGTAYGWVGYWGLWLPNNITVANGDTVNKHDYQTNTDTPYYIFKSGGKLKKHTRQLLTLNDIKNIPLNYNEYSGGTNTNYQVVYGDPANTGTVAFYKTAYMPQCTDNCFWTNTTPTPIDLTQLQWGNLNFWSQSLGGQAQVQLASCATPTCGMNGCTTSCSLPAPTAQSVIFYAENIVYPTDTIPPTLACYDNCLQATSSAGIDVMNPYATTWDPMTGQSTQKSYVFDSTSMLLTDNTTSYAVVSTTTNTQYQWGFMSGALFDPSSTNMALLDCNWDNDNDPATNPQICGWKAWSVLPEFYTWETGPRDYNQFSALKDSGGTFVKFDPPLQVEYIHSQTTTTAPDYKYNGTKFYLDYSGFGQLNGIPGKCVDDGGNTVSCNNNTRWVPEFMIPLGSPVTAGGATYLAKPLDIEQRMSEDASGVGCASLTVGTYTLPTLSDWSDPSSGSDPVTAANEPNITDPPAVIGGVVQ